MYAFDAKKMIAYSNVCKTQDIHNTLEIVADCKSFHSLARYQICKDMQSCLNDEKSFESMGNNEKIHMLRLFLEEILSLKT